MKRLERKAPRSKVQIVTIQIVALIACCLLKLAAIFLAFLDDLLDGADHVESLFRDIVVLAVDDFFESRGSCPSIRRTPRECR